MELIPDLLFGNAAMMKTTAAFICGAALMYLVISRTLKRRAED